MASNPLSSLSYTNKDFNSVYVELLDIVKELSSKWDPTISNESDPGVILLKADAIIADKNNYNIDKNVLEMYPETVTQEMNARNLYKQLAYIMPWYKSATTLFSFRWIGKELVSGESVKIPKYTMLTNADGSVVYTLLAEVVLDIDHQFATCDAIEGTFQTLSINGSQVLNISNLDSNNRIYLPETTVPENGIFIANIDGSRVWEKVDNLQVHARGNAYYEFGVDSRNSVCYIEFPADVDTLVGSGLEIKYVVSQGASGNVAANNIDRFYSDITVTVGEDHIVLNNDVITVYNPAASVNGTDPQSITDAYRSYRKTAGTFNTLVTLRDYINAIYNSGLVSNVIVSDRLNDIQSSYVIRTEDTVNPYITQMTRHSSNTVSYYRDKVDTDDGLWYELDSSGQMTNRTVNQTEIDSGIELYRQFIDNSTADMTAFDLKLYLLHTPGIVNSNSDYQSTFELEHPESVAEQDVKNYIYDQQCIQHDFVSIMENLPCLFKNSYPIGIKIIPQHFVTATQIDQIKRNIISALWNTCNAHAIDFGETPSYDLIYDAIVNSDERIKVAIVDTFNYTTFATYWDSSEGIFKDIPISNSDSKLIIECTKAELDSGKYTRFNNDWTKGTLLASYFICIDDDNVYRYNDSEKRFDIYSTLRKEIQRDIIAKSVIGGRTPLFNNDSRFTYSVNHHYLDEINTDRVTTALVISPFENKTGTFTKDTFTVNNEEFDIAIPDANVDATTGAYQLQDNETIRFLAPSFESSISYSNYVKFQLVLNTSTGSTRNAVRWSESEPNNEEYLIDAEDYNNTVYDYLSKGLCVLRRVDISGEIYHQIIVNKGTHCLTNTSTSNEVQAELFSSVQTADKSYWRVINNDGRVTFQNVNSGKYLTVVTESTCKLESTSSVDDDSNVIYETSNPSHKSDYKIVVESLITSGDITTENPVFENGVCSTTHKQQIWTMLNVPIEGVKFSEPLLKNDNHISLQANVKECTVENVGNTAFPQAVFVDTVVQYWLTESICIARKPDDVDYTDFTGIHIMIDNTDKTQFIDTKTNVTRHNIEGLYAGTRKWLPFIYEKDKVAVAGDGDYQQNTDYRSTAAIIHKSWKQDKVTLYKEETLYRIPANCDYQLNPGDSIVFFWRTDASNDDSAYEYRKYVGIDSKDATATEQSPIIRPSFVVNGCSLNDAQQTGVDPDSLNETGIIEYGDASYKKVYGMYGDNDLSGSKSIDIRGIKQTVLDSGKHNYYFITNNVTSDNNYEMVLTSTQEEAEVTPTDDNKKKGIYKYVLQADEYFVTTNKNYTEYMIAHPGTLIGLEIEWDSATLQDHITRGYAYNQYVLEVPSVPYDQIISEGVTAFSDECKTIPHSHKMYTQEQQVHNVIAGNTLMVKKLNTLATSDLVFTSWKDIAIDSSTYEISYTTSTGETVTLPSIAIQSSTYSWIGRACLNMSMSTDEPQAIHPVSRNKQSVQMIGIITSDKVVKKFPEFTASGNLQLDGLENKTIYVQSDVLVNRVGGVNIDVSYVNLFADREHVNLYFYETESAFGNPPFHIQPEDGKIICKLKEASEYEKFDLVLKSNSTYMLVLHIVSNKDIVSLLDDNNNTIVPLNGRISATSGRLYYVIKTGDALSDDTDQCKVNLTLHIASQPSDEDVVIFDSLFRFTENELFRDRYGFTIDEILSRVRELDIDNVYKYNNRIDSKDELYIEDPLDSKSFFDTNHVMNCYTISKAELQLSQGGDSYIMIVNNR